MFPSFATREALFPASPRSKICFCSKAETFCVSARQGNNFLDVSPFCHDRQHLSQAMSRFDVTCNIESGHCATKCCRPVSSPVPKVKTNLEVRLAFGNIFPCLARSTKDAFFNVSTSFATRETITETCFLVFPGH